MEDIINHETFNNNVKFYIEGVSKGEKTYTLKGWVGLIGGEALGFSLAKSKKKLNVSFAGTRNDVLDAYNFLLTNKNMHFTLEIPIEDRLETLVVNTSIGESAIGPISKWLVYYSDFNNTDKDIISVDGFYKDPDLVREWAMNNLKFSPSAYHKGERAKERFILDGTKEKLEEIIGKPIYNWNHPSYANGIFQFCTADQPIVYHVDNQTYAAMVYLTPDAPPTSGTAFYRSKVTGDYTFDDDKRKTPAYENAFKGKSNEMNFYDGSNFEKIDEVGNVYNRLVLFNAKNIHAATQYFGDGIDNARFFHMFFFDV
tara:strand:- start:2095 stop:3033 length:939 start_codon:yes stop_codon:yes gene_type:complete